MIVGWDVILLVLAVLTLAVFGPRLGIVARLRRSHRNAGRILREDALKHIYHSEYAKTPCTLDSLAGSLGIDRNRAAMLVEELSRRKLIVYTGTEITLTEPGKQYALSVVRVHRLWERYLADETTVEETHWHDEAEKQEHRLSAEEIQTLAHRLGHPVYDPHGDPIPSPGGIVPELKGKPLQSFKMGEVVRIVHVEDEPPLVYAQIVDAGLFPGTTVRILESEPEKIAVEKEGVPVDLSISAAANVTARRVPATQFVGPQRTLTSLVRGASGIVSGISPACRGLQRRRLMDLGVVPGTEISMDIKSAGGDPTAYRIRGALIALRKEQADLVFLEEGSTK